MDPSSIQGGGKALEPQREPSVEYTAQVASPLVNGEAKLAIGGTALTVASLFDTAELPFAEMNALALADYIVVVRADSGDYVFSRMGSWCEPFYDALCEAYNKAVLRSLFVEPGCAPAATAKGDYRYTEGGVTRGGFAPLRVYENSVVVLPPDLGARRVPLCFVDGMERGDYALTLALATGERYTFARLGYDTAPIEAAIEACIRALREKTLVAVREIDPTLTTAQASRIAKLAPEGAAASLGQLAVIAPSFVAALETKIATTRAADSYQTFRELCDPAHIWVGFRKNEVAGDSPSPDPYLLWLIVPSPDGQFAAVEFAEANSATFVYRTGGDFATFARQLNRALEAISFRREVIRLSDDELRKPENADYYMAAKRTAALTFVRTNFVGRAIHATPDSWKRKLTALWSR